MTFFDVFFIGLSLSMDAAAVSMTNSMIYGKCKKVLFIAPVLFGLFQALMPVFGFYFGDIFADFVRKFSGVIAFVILALIGANMIKEGLCKESKECEGKGSLSFITLIMQSVATSIDAFAVGISFSFLKTDSFNIFYAVAIIGFTTLVCSALSVLIGIKFGNALEKKAEILGGIILILIGIKSLFNI